METPDLSAAPVILLCFALLIIIYVQKAMRADINFYQREILRAKRAANESSLMKLKVQIAVKPIGFLLIKFIAVKISQ